MEFSYQARDEDGKLVEGRLSADSVSTAVSQLESQGWLVESINSIRKPQPESKEEQSKEEPKTPRDIPGVSLQEHYRLAIENRSVIVPALVALSGEMPRGDGRAELRQLVDSLENARSAADLNREPLMTRWLPLITAGFDHDSDSKLVGDLIAQTSREADNRTQRRRIIAYPLLALFSALIVFAMLCALLVPTFHEMMDSWGVQVPWNTRLVFFISEQMRTNLFVFLATCGLITFGVYVLLRLWTHFALTTRFFGMWTSGNSANVSAMATFTGQLAELLRINVSVPDALWLAGQASRHYYFRSAAEKLARHAHRGDRPLREAPAARTFPANLFHALEAGPGGTPNVRLLRELSTIYGDRVAQRTDWTTGTVAQMTVVLVAILTAFVVISVFMPLTTLISGLT